jgi:Calx-beta domain/Bacterial Ig-like domain (group 3)
LVCLFVLLGICVPGFGATHTWLGTSSNLVSDAANWSGGSPAGDLDANIVFSNDAVRKAVVNDVAALRFETIQFQSSGFTLSGESLSVSSGYISSYDWDTVVGCDIAVTGELTLYKAEYTGRISGSGSVVIHGNVSFTGSTSNSYTGGTQVEDGFVTLRKTGGAIAFPGNVVIGSGFLPWLSIEEPGQIAATATVDIRKGSLNLESPQTLAKLIVASNTFAGAFESTAPLTLHALAVSGSSIQLNRLQLEDPVLDVPASSSVTIRDSTVADGGLTLRGTGTVSWAGELPAQLVVDGVLAGLNAPNTDVNLQSGIVEGLARSLTATGGRIENFESETDLRLGPGVTLIASEGVTRVRLNGTFDAGGAALEIRETSFDPGPSVVLSNTSTKPVTGTFAGVPEGGIASNRFQLTYTGGDGNDIAVTRVDKLLPSMTFERTPNPTYIGEAVTVTATVAGESSTPTGSVTFTSAEDGHLLDIVTLTGGKASLTITPVKSETYFYARYSGDATYAPKDDGFVVPAQYRIPVISSLDPSSAPSGSVVTVSLHGSYFRDDMTITTGPYGVASGLTFISSTELRATFDLRTIPPQTLQVTVARETSPGQPSNAMPFIVAEVVDPNAMLTFETDAVVGHVTAGAKTAWITSGQRRPLLIPDDDGDGIVRWSWIPVPRENFGIVDLTNGRYEVRFRDGGVTPQPFPEHAFVRGASGNVNHLSLPVVFNTRYTVLWARTGVGAWSAVVDDGSDGDGLQNSVVTLSTANMTALGTAPVPAGFEPGDVVIAMNFRSTAAYAATLAAGFDDLSPGQLSAYGANPSFPENAGVARLPVVRTNGASGTASVQYTTAAVTAVPGVHYTHTTGTLTFGPAETVKWIEVPVLRNGVFDGNYHSFHVVLSSPTGATLGDQTVFVVSISDADPRPIVAFTGPAERRLPEQDASYPYTIDLTLTGATSVPAVVRWQTSRTDIPQSGEIAFAPGETRKSVVVSIPGDDEYGEDRRILVDFTDVSGSTVKERFLTLLIEDDDRRRVTVSDVTVAESSGPARITLAAEPGTYAIGVSYETAARSATAGADFTAVQSSVVFSPTDRQKTITIPIVNDGTLEGDESFQVKLWSDTALLARTAATVVIRDDEQLQRPSVSIAGTTIVEGDEGTVFAAFAVTLSGPSTMTVKVEYATADGTATAGADYEATQSAVTIARGQTAATILIPILGDVEDEPDESFSVELTSALNAVVQEGRAQGVIVDDDVTRTKRRAMRR